MKPVVVDAITAAEARDLTDRIKVAVEGTWLLVKQAYESRAWAMLGYASWDDYCSREFGASRIRLPREERAEVVASLRESGLSIRAIAAATGISDQTVQRDLSAGVVNHCTSEEERVTGTDGKTYPAKPTAMELKQAAKEHPTTPSSRLPRADRVEQITTLASAGNNSHQIAKQIGVDPHRVRLLAREENIPLPDDIVGKTRHHDSNRILAETVATLEGLGIGLRAVEMDSLDPTQIEHWTISLSNSLRSLNRLNKQLKEMSRDE